MGRAGGKTCQSCSDSGGGAGQVGRHVTGGWCCTLAAASQMGKVRPGEGGGPHGPERGHSRACPRGLLLGPAFQAHPFPPGPWKSALGTSNPGSWYKQGRNDLCRGQGFSEAGVWGGHRGGRQVPVPRALLCLQGCLGDESTVSASGGTGVCSRPAGPWVLGGKASPCSGHVIPVMHGRCGHHREERAAHRGHSGAVPVLSGGRCLHWLLSILPRTSWLQSS